MYRNPNFQNPIIFFYYIQTNLIKGLDQLMIVRILRDIRTIIKHFSNNSNFSYILEFQLPRNRSIDALYNTKLLHPFNRYQWVHHNLTNTNRSTIYYFVFHHLQASLYMKCIKKMLQKKKKRMLEMGYCSIYYLDMLWFSHILCLPPCKKWPYGNSLMKY